MSGRLHSRWDDERLDECTGMTNAGEADRAIECLAFRTPAASDVINYTAARVATGEE